MQSGVAAPIVNSGIIVDGIFYATASTTGTFARIIDFPDGRVIFNAALSGSPTVEANFSYKEVTVDSASVFNNENKPYSL